jgi:hypothetical protein
MDLKKQEHSKWCWAAVTAAVHNSLNDGGGEWTQGAIATQVLRHENQIPTGVNCEATPLLCDLTAGLHDALDITGNLVSPDGFRPNAHLSFDNIKIWVNAQLPICARIRWWGGGAHFIAIDGFREFQTGEQQVHVQDPFYGPSFQNYSDLVSGYPPGGNWQDTYLVKKSPLEPPNGGH